MSQRSRRRRCFSPADASDSPCATDILCERCGYILRGLAATANCPECGRPIGASVGDHRRPSAFETAPSLPSLARTALAVFFRPGRFFAQLAMRPMGTRANWFARCHRFVAATLFSVAACGLVILDHTFPTWLDRIGWGRDEPEVYGLLLAPVTLIIYLLIIVATRICATLISAIAVERAIRLPRASVQRALSFHSVHLMAAAFVVAAAVGGLLSLLVTPMAVIFYIVVAQVTTWLAGGRIARRPFWWLPGALAIPVMTRIAAWYFNEFGGPRFDRVGAPPADWPTYLYTIAAAIIVAASYLLLTLRLAIRNIMYANDAITLDESFLTN